MGFLAGKRLLITGVLSNRSIAYGIARACRREGAELAFSYQGERFKERVAEFAAEFGSTLVFDCDVADDAQIEAHVRRPGRGLAELRRLRPLDRLRAQGSDRRRLPRRPVARGVPDRPRHLELQLPGAWPRRRAGRLAPGAALLTLTYLGALRSVPNYNTMGLAKASLEASVRYLAASLGPKGVRVNGISAGPIKTLAASGIKGFGKILDVVAQNAPLRRNVTIDDVGNVAAFLLSDLAAGVTSEIVYVDGGFSHAMPGGGAGHGATRLSGAAPCARSAAVGAHAVDEVLPSSMPTPCSSVIDIRPCTSVSKPGKAVLKARVKRR